MSEMALTADHLIVVGRGRLLADCSIADFIAQASPAVVRVRSPHADAPARAAARRGRDGRLRRAGRARGRRASTTDAIGERAAAEGLALHELSPRHASLEEAFMELTRDAVEYEAAA